MLDTYYRSATANDCFIAYDIVNLPQMPNLVSFAAHRAEQMHTADLRIMALSSKDLGSPNLPIYLKALHPDGAAGIEWQGKSEASTSFVDTIPYVTSAKKLSYWQGQIFGWRTNWTELLSTSAGRDDAIEKLVAAIEKVAGDHKPPFVILVYADIHNYSRLCELAASVAAKLDPARLEVSRLDAALRTLKSP
jgi:hypothetical protein